MPLGYVYVPLELYVCTLGLCVCVCPWGFVLWLCVCVCPRGFVYEVHVPLGLCVKDICALGALCVYVCVCVCVP